MAISPEEIKRSYPWLTAELFENSLKKRYNNSDIKVINCDLSSALGPGENYASVVIRAKLVLENAHQRNMNVVVKVSHTREDLVEMMEDFNLFDKEIYFYTDILGEVHSLLKQVGIDVKLSADLIGSGIKPTYVMFEDLSLYGFKNVNKSVGLDYEHLKLTMTKIAYYHAATAYLGQTNPSKVEFFKDGMINEKNKDKPNPFANYLKILGAEVCKWDGYEDIGNKLLKLSSSVTEYLLDFFSKKSTTINVINHGDLWCNNIMYKHNPGNGKLEDVILVDYSIGYWGGPGQDLSYFLYSSSAIDITEKEWDCLLQHYHSILKSTLEKLKFDGKLPSLMDIQVALLHGSQYSMFVSLMVCAIRQLVNHEEGTIGNLIDETEEAKAFQRRLYSNPKFKTTATKLLSFFDRKGILV